MALYFLSQVILMELHLFITYTVSCMHAHLYEMLVQSDRNIAYIVFYHDDENDPFSRLKKYKCDIQT